MLTKLSLYRGFKSKQSFLNEFLTIFKELFFKNQLIIKIFSILFWFIDSNCCYLPNHHKNPFKKTALRNISRMFVSFVYFSPSRVSFTCQQYKIHTQSSQMKSFRRMKWAVNKTPFIVVFWRVCYWKEIRVKI